VLAQFSRNIYRDDPRSFAWDPMALCLAKEAVRIGADQPIAQEQRVLLYAFMHSVWAVIHEWSMKLFGALESEASLDDERRHKAIIDRFGRFPHRNRILGRETTSEEIDFPTRNGSSL